MTLVLHALFSFVQTGTTPFENICKLQSSERFPLNDSTPNFKHLQLTQLTKRGWNDLCLFAFPFHCSCKIDRLFAFLVVFKSHTSIAAFSRCVFTLNTGVLCKVKFAIHSLHTDYERRRNLNLTFGTSHFGVLIFVVWLALESFKWFDKVFFMPADGSAQISLQQLDKFQFARTSKGKRGHAD